MPKKIFGGGFFRIVLGEKKLIFWFFTSKTALFLIFLLVYSLIPPVSFLIVSAGFLILSADILIVSVDAIRKPMLRRIGWGALSLSCEDLWPSWEGKSEKIVDIFSPRIFAKGAKEHESGSPLQLLYKGECSALVLGPVRLVRPVGEPNVGKQKSNKSLENPATSGS